MTPAALFVVLVGLALVAYWLGKSRALAVVGGSRGMRNLHSLPSYYGALTALWCALPAVVVLGAVARVSGLDHHRAGQGASAGPDACSESGGTGLGAQRRAQRRGGQRSRGRRYGQRCGRRRRNTCIFASVSQLALTALVLVFGIIGTIIVRARIAPASARAQLGGADHRMAADWLLADRSVHHHRASSRRWPSRPGASSARFPGTNSCSACSGARRRRFAPTRSAPPARSAPCRCSAGTALISGIAMLIAVPIGLFSAIYLAEYAHPQIPRVDQAVARRSSPASRRWCTGSSLR